MVIPEILAAVGGASFAYQLAQDYSKARAGYRKHFNYIWEQPASLDPEIFFEGRFKYYKDYYYPRDEDRDIEDAINNQKNVLILGRPLAGKSRAVFEVLKKIEKSCFILKPRPVDIEIENYTFPKLPGNMKKVMFLDDLHIFAEKENFDYLFEVARKNKLIIVATCRSGFEYDLLEHKLPRNLTIESIFDKVVTYDTVPKPQAQLIASKLDINWQEAEFDGTIGSIIMKLGPMKKRYKGLPQNEIEILRILRRLYCAGVSEEGHLFFVDTIETFAKAKGIISNTNDLNHLLESLISKEFIENPVEDVYRAEEIYLEKIFDFGVKVERISILDDVIDTFAGIADVLLKAGEQSSLYSLIEIKKADYAKTAIKAYNKTLEVYTLDNFKKEYAKVHINLGLAYFDLSDVEETETNVKKSIDAYMEALKVYTFDEFPIQYAATKNNLGNVYSGIAYQQTDKISINKSIDAYLEALKVYTFDEFPIRYAMTNNNLGTAYWNLSKIDEKEMNLEKSIKSYIESLNVYTLDHFPIEYAATMNNLGIAYRNLAEIENAEKKEMNLEKAIVFYRNALRVYTRNRYPIYYATVKNNIGIVYMELSSIRDKKDNLSIAITELKEALQIFELAKMEIKAEPLRSLISILQAQLQQT